jgi:hypothetical protein
MWMVAHTSTHTKKTKIVKGGKRAPENVSTNKDELNFLLKYKTFKFNHTTMVILQLYIHIQKDRK